MSYRQYQTLLGFVAKKLNKKESEVERVPLWHGADETAVAKICKGTFNRGYAGINGEQIVIQIFFNYDNSRARSQLYEQIFQYILDSLLLKNPMILSFMSVRNPLLHGLHFRDCAVWCQF